MLKQMNGNFANFCLWLRPLQKSQQLKSIKQNSVLVENEKRSQIVENILKKGFIIKRNLPVSLSTC